MVYYSHYTLHNKVLSTPIMSCLFSIILQNRHYYYYYLLVINEEPSTQKGEVMPSCLYSEQVTGHYWSSGL